MYLFTCAGDRSLCCFCCPGAFLRLLPPLPAVSAFIASFSVTAFCLTDVTEEVEEDDQRGLALLDLHDSPALRECVEQSAIAMTTSAIAIISPNSVAHLNPRPTYLATGLWALAEL